MRRTARERKMRTRRMRMTIQPHARGGSGGTLQGRARSSGAAWRTSATRGRDAERRRTSVLICACSFGSGPPLLSARAGLACTVKRTALASTSMPFPTSSSRACNHHFLERRRSCLNISYLLFYFFINIIIPPFLVYTRIYIMQLPAEEGEARAF